MSRNEIAWSTALASLRATPCTAALFLRHGAAVGAWGDTERPTYVASVRKSILSLLVGIAHDRGLIELDSTLRDLGIDDVGGLSTVEAGATVRDLLTSSSGVYHPAGSPGGVDDLVRDRGRFLPGERFAYNNWDFNVIGTILEDATGMTLFDAFESWLVRPLGMTDVVMSEQVRLGNPERSRHLANHLFLSARDLARIGQLVLNEGRWDAQQVVSPEWISASTSLQIHIGEDGASPGSDKFDYGYLWWIPRTSLPGWTGSAVAMGNFGQYIFVLPEIDGVVVLRREVDRSFAIARNASYGQQGDTPSPEPTSLTNDDALEAVRRLVQHLL